MNRILKPFYSKNSRERKDIFWERLDISHGCLFLDRDGVIIEDRHFVSETDRVKLCPGAKELFGKAEEFGIPIIIVTNQSGIGRELFGWRQYEEVTKKMLELINSTDCVAAIYANSSLPGEIDASWRKPMPGMMLEAAKDINIKLKRSIIIGDRLTDLKAGINAGLKCAIHVKGRNAILESELVKQFKKAETYRSSSIQTKIIEKNSLIEINKSWNKFMSLIKITREES